MIEDISKISIYGDKEPTCDCCGKPWSELPEFETEIPIDIGNINAGFKKIKTRIIKTYRKEGEDDDGFTVGSSWECKDCLCLSTEEYWNTINARTKHEIK